MLNYKQQKEFEQMVETGIKDNVWEEMSDSIEDLTYPQSDEIIPDYIPLEEPISFIPEYIKAEIRILECVLEITLRPWFASKW